MDYLDCYVRALSSLFFPGFVRFMYGFLFSRFKSFSSLRFYNTDRSVLLGYLLATRKEKQIRFLSSLCHNIDYFWTHTLSTSSTIEFLFKINFILLKPNTILGTKLHIMCNVWCKIYKSFDDFFFSYFFLAIGFWICIKFLFLFKWETQDTVSSNRNFLFFKKKNYSSSTAQQKKIILSFPFFFFSFLFGLL